MQEVKNVDNNGNLTYLGICGILQGEGLGQGQGKLPRESDD